MSRNKIEIRGLTKVFGRDVDEALELVEEGAEQDEILERTGATVALRDVSFDAPEGRISVIMGLSGSGKSTLARCLNRLIEPTRGEIVIDGRDVLAMDQDELRELRQGEIGMVFQQFALWPHRTVLENVVYGLEIQDVGREEREQRAREVIETVGLDGWEDSMPRELSGGMQQRVGLARALAIDPEILLMDEPFSALDPLVRREMQEELLDLQERLQKTILFITHDLDEAIKIGAHMAIMRAGEVVQTGEPEAILRDPADDYVASFVEDVDPSRILRARDVMFRPDDLIRPGHAPRVALRLMERQGLSSSFVVDEGGRLAGLVTADAAADAADRGLDDVTETALHDVATAEPDTPLQELIDRAADEPYPIAIVDEDGGFRGIVAWVSIVKGLSRARDVDVPTEVDDVEGPEAGAEPARAAG